MCCSQAVLVLSRNAVPKGIGTKLMLFRCASGLAGRAGHCLGLGECSPFALPLAEAFRFGPLGTVLLPLGAPKSRTVAGGRLEVDEVHPMGIRVGRADAEDLGVVEVPRAVLCDKGVHHPVGAAKHEAAAVARRVRVDLLGHAPQDDRMYWSLGWM